MKKRRQRGKKDEKQRAVKERSKKGKNVRSKMGIMDIRKGKERHDISRPCYA